MVMLEKQALRGSGDDPGAAPVLVDLEGDPDFGIGARGEDGGQVGAVEIMGGVVRPDALPLQRLSAQGGHLGEEVSLGVRRL